MPRRLPLKVVFAASVFLIAAHAAASSHAHEGDHADEACLVCVASADFAQEPFVPLAYRPATTLGECEGRTAAPYPVQHADYSARAPPSS